MRVAKGLACLGLFGLAFLNVYAVFGVAEGDVGRSAIVLPALNDAPSADDPAVGDFADDTPDQAGGGKFDDIAG